MPAADPPKPPTVCSRSMTGQPARIVALGAAVGIGAALIANVFVFGIGWLNDLLLISPRSRMMETRTDLLATATVVVPAIGGLAGGLIHCLIGERRPQAPADLIAAVQSRSGHAPFKDGLLSGVSAWISLGFGASVGLYGPIVHLGGTIGSGLARVFRTDVTGGNTAIACGVAAAISTVFNAPIAGILFAHEVILRHFALRAFAPVAVASVLGFVTANAVLPQPPLFQVGTVEIRHLWEFGWFVVLGVASAAVAMAYMKAILTMTEYAGRLPVPAILRPALAGAGLGLAALWFPEILGIGAETLRLAFIPGAFTQWELLLVLTLKLLATAWCLGMGFAGGVFSPALVIGSLFGALFGSVLGSALGAELSALVVYAVCGMVAVTAPVIGAPLTAVIIIFEMTGSYELTIAALASVSLANLLASRYYGRSLFDRQLADRGLDLSGGRSTIILDSRSIRDLVSDRCVRIHPETPVEAARRSMGRAGSADACLVSDDGRYCGTVRLQDLVAVDAKEPVGHWRDPEAISMSAETSIWEAMNQLREFVGEGVPVLDDDSRLLGTVFESDLIDAYLELLESTRREEHAAA